MPSAHPFRTVRRRVRRLLPWWLEYHCDNCDDMALFKWSQEPNYCPFCGADAPTRADDQTTGRWSP